MTRDHAAIEELLAVRSLMGLDGDDRARLERALESHGDCAECRRLAQGFDETAGMLGFALEPTPVGPGQADEILRRASHPATQEVAPVPPPIPIDELRRRRSRRRAWPALAAAAAAMVLVISAVIVIGPLRSTGVTVSTGQQVVTFSGGTGELAMAYRPGEPGALFLGSGFTDPGSGKTYEIWMLRGETAVSSGCVRPHDGSILAFLHADLGGTDRMAVTVEPEACPSQPTSAPILVSEPLIA